MFSLQSLPRLTTKAATWEYPQIRVSRDWPLRRPGGATTWQSRESRTPWSLAQKDHWKLWPAHSAPPSSARMGNSGDLTCCCCMSAAELLHDFRVLRRHVAGFAGVLGKVVEFKRGGLCLARPGPWDSVQCGWLSNRRRARTAGRRSRAIRGTGTVAPPASCPARSAQN